MKLSTVVVVVLACMVVATTALDTTDISTGRTGVDDNALTINDTDMFSISENDNVMDQWELMVERKKKCSPSISCRLAGGHCVKARKDCDGTIDRSGCRGPNKCSCCIPEKITPAPLTCPACPTCPAITTTPRPTTEAGTCDTRGVLIGNQCLELVLEKMRWSDAVAACTARNSNSFLAKPEDHQALIDYLKTIGGFAFWVGATDSASEGEFVWLDGTAVQVPWYSGQPDNANGLSNGNEDCVVVNRIGYHDTSCQNLQIYYLCDIGGSN